MRYPLFHFDFRTQFRGKSFAVIATCNRTQGLVLTAYWDHTPIFNLLSDRFAEYPSPLQHEHEWGIVRWGPLKREPYSEPPKSTRTGTDDPDEERLEMYELLEELWGTS